MKSLFSWEIVLGATLDIVLSGRPRRLGEFSVFQGCGFIPCFLFVIGVRGGGEEQLKRPRVAEVYIRTYPGLLTRCSYYPPAIFGHGLMLNWDRSLS